MVIGVSVICFSEWTMLSDSSYQRVFHVRVWRGLFKPIPSDDDRLESAPMVASSGRESGETERSIMLYHERRILQKRQTSVERRSDLSGMLGSEAELPHIYWATGSHYTSGKQRSKSAIDSTLHCNDPLLRKFRITASE